MTFDRLSSIKKSETLQYRLKEEKRLKGELRSQIKLGLNEISYRC